MRAARRPLLVLPLLALSLSVLTVLGPSVRAEPAGSAISDPVVTPDGLTMTVTGTGLDRGSLRVRVDGAPVAVSPSGPGPAAAAQVPTRIALVVDTSASMAGTAITAARGAAASFARTVARADLVGLVTFADRPSVLVRPTADRAPVFAALNRLRAAGNTSLYDAVDAAIALVGTSGPRRVVVLSDGGDTRSSAKVADVERRLRASGTSLDAVALTTSEAASPGLRRLASATGGRVVPVTSAGALSRALQTLRAAPDQLTVTVPLPPGSSGRAVRLDVSISGASGRLSRTSSVALPAGPRAAPPASHLAAPVGRALLWAGLGVLGLGLLALVLTVGALAPAGAADRKRMRALMGGDARPGPVTSDPVAPAGRFGDGAAAKTAVEWAGRVATRGDRGHRLAASLERADIRFTPAEWLVLQAVCGLTALACVAVVSGSLVLSVLAGVVALLAPSALVRFRGRRRVQAFQTQLPDSLRLASSSLLSGYSFPQALDGIVREGSQPMAGEISRALAEARVGVALEDALDKVADRMGSTDLHWTVMAVRVQRDVGGNLAEVLNTVASTVRERAYLRRQVRTLSAEGRLSAYVLVGMPIAVATYTYLARRSYMSVLWTTTPGQVMSVAAVLLLVTGSLWMRKLIDVEV